jgi:glycosyltransferase involved in cell wall biosynthesis
MRIAVIDHVSAGGVSRFVANLIDGLAARHEVERIAYFVPDFNIQRDDLGPRWISQAKVELVPIGGALDSAWAWEKTAAHGVAKGAAARLRRCPRVYALARGLYRRFRPILGGPRTQAPWYRYTLDPVAMDRLEEFDVVYVAWPYFIEPLRTTQPVVATFHDFHFEHFPESYPADQLATAREQTPQWLSAVDVAVTSTQFISSEIDTFFETKPARREIVYLAPYTNAEPSGPNDEDLLRSLRIRHPYAIYSGGTSAHKNLLGLFTALASIAPEARPMLVITGVHTDQIGRGNAPEDHPVHAVDELIRERGLESGRDFVALGYVSERDVDELTRAADVVISASRYEAGCGPALDAWKLAAPVALSGIPPFLEQMHRFGVEARVFDPEDSTAIADAVLAVLADPGEARAGARRSQAAILSYTWDDVAAGYLAAFEQAIEAHQRGLK